MTIRPTYLYIEDLPDPAPRPCTVEADQVEYLNNHFGGKMPELSLDLLQFEEGLMKCRQIFDIPIQDFSTRQRLEMLAPDRTVGVIAAYEYLQHHVMKINAGIAIPAIGLLIIALMIGVVAWGLA